MMTGRLQLRRSVDQKESIVDEMFLCEFREVHLGQWGGLGRIKTHLEQAVGVWIDSSVQPVTMIVDQNYGLANGDVIRIVTLGWM